MTPRPAAPPPLFHRSLSRNRGTTVNFLAVLIFAVITRLSRLICPCSPKFVVHPQKHRFFPSFVLISDTPVHRLNCLNFPVQFSGFFGNFSGFGTSARQSGRPSCFNPQGLCCVLEDMQMTRCKKRIRTCPPKAHWQRTSQRTVAAVWKCPAL